MPPSIFQLIITLGIISAGQTAAAFDYQAAHQQTSARAAASAAPWVHECDDGTGGSWILAAGQKPAGRSVLQAPVEGVPLGQARPLRIKPWYSFSGDANPAAVKTITEVIMPRAILAAQRALHVRAPVTGNLLIPRRCAKIWEASGACATLDTSYCDGEVSNLSPQLMGSTRVCLDNPEECSQTTAGDGTPDADFLLIIKSNSSQLCEEQPGTYASACAQDSDNWYGLPGRPLMGFISFCGAAMASARDGMGLDRLVDTAVREIMHVLFMSPHLFDSYIDQRGVPLPVKATIKGDFVVAPTVVKVLREHLDCKTVSGAPLEPGHSTGTRGANWAAAVFRNELMAGVSTDLQRQPLSKLTLALAKDSGWYMPVWNAAGFLRYGHRSGCSLLDGCSAANDTAAAALFCDDASLGERSCILGDTTATCRADPLTGCPTLLPNLDGRCTAVPVSDRPEGLGYSFGPSSLCLDVPGQGLRRQVGSQTVSNEASTVCVASECRAEGLHVLIQNAQDEGFESYACPEGDFVSLSTSQGFPPGTALGPCPPPDSICSYKGCPLGANGAMCSGQGECYNGACFCAVDRAGPACASLLCSSSQDCPDGGTCSPDGTCGAAAAASPGGTSIVPLGEQVSAGLAQADTWARASQPLRALRLGYLHKCLFYLDTDGDGRKGSEEWQEVSAATGELGLESLAENATLLYAVEQDPLSSCTDTLSARTAPALQLSAPPGGLLANATNATVNVFSTAASWLQRTQAMGTEEAVQQVGDAMGLPAATIRNSDWLHGIVTDSRTPSQREVDLKAWETAAATVLAVELYAPLAELSGDDLTTGAVTSLLAIVSEAQGSPLALLGDPARLTALMQNASALPPSAEATSRAVADAVAAVVAELVLVEEVTRAPEGGFRRPLATLQGWAGVAHVADTVWVPATAQLVREQIEEALYRELTSPSELARLAGEYSVDLERATLIHDYSPLDTRDWLTRLLEDGYGALPGWVWIVPASAAVIAAVASCYVCLRRQRPPPEAKTRELKHMISLKSAGGTDGLMRAGGTEDWVAAGDVPGARSSVYVPAGDASSDWRDPSAAAADEKGLRRTAQPASAAEFEAAQAQRHGSIDHQQHSGNAPWSSMSPGLRRASAAASKEQTAGDDPEAEGTSAGLQDGSGFSIEYLPTQGGGVSAMPGLQQSHDVRAEQLMQQVHSLRSQRRQLQQSESGRMPGDGGTQGGTGELSLGLYAGASSPITASGGEEDHGGQRGSGVERLVSGRGFDWMGDPHRQWPPTMDPR